MGDYHVSCKHWKIEPGSLELEPDVQSGPIEPFRTPEDPHKDKFGHFNLRAFAGAANHLEHVLEIVMRIDNTVIEMSTASEPLYFGHSNWGDEYNILFPTGDEMVDNFPGRTVFTDTDTAEQLGYVKATNGAMTVHPVGMSHWPGKLKEPEKIFIPPDEIRRKLFAVVFCSAGQVDYNETLAPRKSVSMKEWSGNRLPQFAKVKVGEIKIHHDIPSRTEGRIGARSLIGMSIESDREMEKPEAVARVGTATLDFFVTEGTTGNTFKSDTHSYLIAYFGRPKVEFFNAAGKRVACSQMGEADVIRIPAGVSFRFVIPEPENHAALLWMRKSVAGEPNAGVRAEVVGGFPLHKVVNG